LRTNVYVDGFNLCYGCLKGTPYKWLDLDAMCRRLLPKHELSRIRYFTAIISARPLDPSGPVRQQAYLRALATMPHVSIHLGHFLTSHVRMPLAVPPARGPRTVEVIKTEEKGSDVNLATYLLGRCLSPGLRGSGGHHERLGSRRADQDGASRAQASGRGREPR